MPRWAPSCMVLIFIVVIIGGLGSVGGCFVGALLVALADQLRRLPRPRSSRSSPTSC